LTGLLVYFHEIFALFNSSNISVIKENASKMIIEKFDRDQVTTRDENDAYANLFCRRVACIVREYRANRSNKKKSKRKRERERERSLRYCVLVSIRRRRIKGKSSSDAEGLREEREGGQILIVFHVLPPSNVALASISATYGSSSKESSCTDTITACQNTILSRLLESATRWKLKGVAGQSFLPARLHQQ